MARRLTLWSILFFAVPLALAWQMRLIPMAAILASVIVASFANHLSKKKIFRLLDAAFAWMLMITQLYLCAIGHFSFPAFALVLILVPIAIFFFFRRKHGSYDLNHALWHLFSAAICVSALLTYRGGIA